MAIRCKDRSTWLVQSHVQGERETFEFYLPIRAVRDEENGEESGQIGWNRHELGLKRRPLTHAVDEGR